MFDLSVKKRIRGGGDDRKVECETWGTRDDKTLAVGVLPIGVLRITRIQGVRKPLSTPVSSGTRKRLKSSASRQTRIRE